MMAVPLAWISRPASRLGNAQPSAATRVPALNSDIASANTARVDRRAISQPVTGITTAMVSMNPVVSHWAVRSSMARSAMIRDSATLSAVSLRITTKAPTRSTASTRTEVGGSRSGAAVGAAGTAGSSSVRAIDQLPFGALLCAGPRHRSAGTWTHSAAGRAVIPQRRC